MKKQAETKTKTKADKNHIPDYEHLFTENTNPNDKGNSTKIYKHLLFQYKWMLIVSTILYVVKHLPFLLIPLITAEVINIITAGGPNTARNLVLCGICLSILLAENIPMHVLREKLNNEMLRSIGAGLRNTLVRKLQHLSLTYHKEMESGRLQSKFMRDIEVIETLNRQLTNTLLPAIINVIIYVIIALTKSGIVTLFFAAVIPINVLVVYSFRNSMKTTNQKFRKENENISAKVSSMIDMIPVTKAHGLESEEIIALEKKIKDLKQHGLLVDRTNAYFGSVSWVASQVMSGICLFFTAYLAIIGKIEIGDVVMFQSYFNSISSALQGLINIYPELAKGVESVQSVSEIIVSNDVEDNNGKIRIRYVHGTVQFNDVSYRYPK